MPAAADVSWNLLAEAERLLREHEDAWKRHDGAVARDTLQRFLRIVTETLPRHPDALRLVRAHDPGAHDDAALRASHEYQRLMQRADELRPRLAQAAPTVDLDADDDYDDDDELAAYMDEYDPHNALDYLDDDFLHPAAPAVPKADQRVPVQPPHAHSPAPRADQRVPHAVLGSLHDFDPLHANVHGPPPPITRAPARAAADNGGPLILLDDDHRGSSSSSGSSTGAKPSLGFPSLLVDVSPPPAAPAMASPPSAMLIDITPPATAARLTTAAAAAATVTSRAAGSFSDVDTLFDAPAAQRRPAVPLAAPPGSAGKAPPSNVRRPYVPPAAPVKVTRSVNEIMQHKPGLRPQPLSMTSYSDPIARMSFVAARPTPFDSPYQFFERSIVSPAPASTLRPAQAPRPVTAPPVAAPVAPPASLPPTPPSAQPTMASTPSSKPSTPSSAPRGRPAATVPLTSFAPNASPLAPILPPLDASSPVTNGVIGFRNLGNTCYMNSTLQCLSATLMLTRKFLDGSYVRWINTTNPLGTKGALARAYADLLNQMWHSQQAFLSPHVFKAAIAQFATQFQGDDQHDSQELLAFLLDGLHEDLNRVRTKPTVTDPDSDGTSIPDDDLAEVSWQNYLRRNDSIIVDLFQGQYKSVVACLACGRKSVSFNAFMYLSVPVPLARDASLAQCLDMFTAAETLTEDDGWFCPRCETQRRATKQLQLWRLPDYLLIHLKRFSFDGPWRSKITTDVRFPLQLQIRSASPRDRQTHVYDLYSVSNHFGSLTGGHYTACCQSSYSRRWHYFDDSRVSIVPESNVQSPAAYILFYARRKAGGGAPQASL